MHDETNPDWVPCINLGHGADKSPAAFNRQKGRGKRKTPAKFTCAPGEDSSTSGCGTETDTTESLNIQTESQIVSGVSFSGLHVKIGKMKSLFSQ
ncbi:hypothetical protein PoB_004578100 [Plakobranchus ocellatus]|uniref:Uncharacterized protein n=1 Tax=Plakobranchus ocellatus TaxID=259542 RepID=A0AAV4BJX5_9GAST|nr:hypothetical protein PoB_004578100 [Plakobranchus ocellatus]